MENAMRKAILIILTIIMAFGELSAQNYADFRSIDSLSYALFQDSKWRAHTRLTRQAPDHGIDYFYLRLRNGIAWYNLENYVQAEAQLKKALEFNPGDQTAMEYLYYAYLMVNKGNNALSTLRDSPGTLQEFLRSNYPPRFNSVHLDGGAFLSNQGNAFGIKDLDGKDDYYGEADVFNHAVYVSAGGRWLPSPDFSASLNYSFLTLDKNKLFSSGDTIMLDHPYAVDQHQLYLSMNVYPGNGFSITPAFHLVNYRMNTVYATYDSLDYSYAFMDTAINNVDYIGFLGLKKDYGIIHTGVFCALANLNEQNQYQAGFDVIAFPAGNLDYYLQGQFIAHFNDGDVQPVVHAMVGARLLKPLWTEFSATFGETENYFENDASVVYNFSDRIRYRYGVRMYFTLSPRWLLGIDYQYLGKEADILVYEEKGTNGSSRIVPVLYPQQYFDHFITASLSWKL